MFQSSILFSRNKVNLFGTLGRVKSKKYFFLNWEKQNQIVVIQKVLILEALNIALLLKVNIISLSILNKKILNIKTINLELINI